MAHLGSAVTSRLCCLRRCPAPVALPLARGTRTAVEQGGCSRVRQLSQPASRSLPNAYSALSCPSSLSPAEPGTAFRGRHFLAASNSFSRCHTLSSSSRTSILSSSGSSRRRTHIRSMEQQASASGGAEAATAGAGDQGLAGEKCIPCHNKTLQPLSRAEAESLLQQEVPTWKLLDVEGVPRLRRSWKTKNFLAGLELFKRISEIAEAEGHHPDLHLEGWNNARVEVFTHSIGGLHKNDFILAAKINALDIGDLLRKPKKSIVAQ